MYMASYLTWYPEHRPVLRMGYVEMSMVRGFVEGTLVLGERMRNCAAALGWI